MKSPSAVLLALAPLAAIAFQVPAEYANLPKPAGNPQPPPDYAKNNINNLEGVAPDKGVLDGPVLHPLNASMLTLMHGGDDLDDMADGADDTLSNFTLSRRDDGGYWLPGVVNKGHMPLAPSGYQFYRDVTDFGAKGDGSTDDTAAINRAVAAFSKDNTDKTRCGKECGSTTTLQALVYFPPGNYVVSSPIIQYYHTQFVGNALKRPTLKGAKNFSGIAMVDNDPYIPKGSGAEWYINQSNFLRQIRNMIFDLTDMPNRNRQGIQRYVPTGIHWQVGQGTSISDCDFRMPIASDDKPTTAVGIFMENGSGGVMSNLNFVGGNIGLIAGSQQFTATNFNFISCQTGIKQIWNWGFVYKNIIMLSCGVGFDCTAYSDATKQGVGSIALIDSQLLSVHQPITVGTNSGRRPNLVLDNVQNIGSGPTVSVPGGETVLDGAGTTVKQWVSGYEVLPGDDAGSKRTGDIKPQLKRPEKLVDEKGNYFYKAKPNYEKAAKVFVVTDMGVQNDGTGDQTEAINKILDERQPGDITYFPAGIYQVKGTVKVPPNTIIVGSSWSQIQGTGSYFEDENSPKVMVRVGKPGDWGIIEISDMIFTVKGPTAGCILMEWNIRQITQGNVAMWDSHFRVGGAEGSDLQVAECPAKASSVDKKCKAASMILHMTPNSSGYFDNVWVWTADHDLDNPANAETYETDDGIPRNTKTQVSVYSARGVLVESKGPTWFYGTASEHNQMYQYQLQGASNIFFGHMQTETPYYQPNPTATGPYLPGNFRSDPTFLNCKEGDKSCQTSWALRILHSKDVVIYGGGFYSFFQDNDLGCTEKEDCQKSMIETSYSDGIWIYNIFTKGNQEIVTPAGNHFKTLEFDDSTRNGYTSEIAAWLPLALDGSQYGDDEISAGNDQNGYDDVDDSPVCDFGRKVDSLEDLTKAPDLTSMCRALLAFPFLIAKLDSIWEDYEEVNKGYDATFKYYAKYFRAVVEEEISNCTHTHDELFRCRNYNGNDQGPWTSCNDLAKKVNFDPYFSLEYDCLEKDKYEGFLKDEYGVNNTWVKYGRKNVTQPCRDIGGGRPNPDCQDILHFWSGLPMLADHFDVPNPKDIIGKAGDKLETVKSNLYSTYGDMLTSQWSGSYEDALEIFSVPVGVMGQAVESMKFAKAKGEEVHKREQRDLIVNILGIVFAVLPFVGELLEPLAGFAFLGRLVTLIGEAGDAAVNLETIALNPETAPMVLIGALAGTVGIKIRRSGKDFEQLKAAKVTMDENGMVGKFGKFAKEYNDLVQQVITKCIRG
ncbi:hypothetical protein PWT90_05834 [Aphanocladium album]|nr:hypothetical protein PWT90_05834 [Aphanocladium album]